MTGVTRVDWDAPETNQELARDLGPPPGARNVSSSILDDEPAAIENTDPSAQRFDLGEQMTGQEDRRAAGVEREEQLADFADALRVKAIGRLVEDKQLGLPHQCRGEPKALAHAERVGLYRAPIDPGQSDPLQRGVDPTPPSRPNRCLDRSHRARPRLARPDKWPYAAGPSTREPTRGNTSRPRRGIGRPSSSTSPDVASTNPRTMRSVVVLPEPFAPRNP